MAVSPGPMRSKNGPLTWAFVDHAPDLRLCVEEPECCGGLGQVGGGDGAVHLSGELGWQVTAFGVAGPAGASDVGPNEREVGSCSCWDDVVAGG